MNKEEFLAELKACLGGKMSPEEIESNIDYYRAYIEGEMMSGRSEQEILEELGPARLIAKNLTANIRDDNHSKNQRGSYYSDSEGNESYGQNESEEPYEDPSIKRKANGRKIATGVIIAIIIILILFLFGSMFRGVIYLVFRFLPIIVIFALFSWIYRGRGRR